jgi:hypothetical protein
MQRDDLLHLSPEALTQMANAGLVKRAVRELGGGYRPQIQVDEAGALTAQFDDGVRSTLPRGVPLQHTQCSCGATGLCRHRLIAVLAYREGAEASEAAEATDAAQPNDAATAPSGTAANAHTESAPGAASSRVSSGTPQAPPLAAGEADTPAHASLLRSTPLDVADTTDARLAELVPASLLQAAERLKAEGLSIELRRRASGEPCDTARLPSATVRFWAGAAIEAARCDCLRAAACEHVALGVWAFQQARAQGDGDAPRLTVRLGQAGARQQVDAAPFQAFTAALLRHGVAQGPAALMQALSGARQACGEATWLSLLMADLEAWAEAYAARSALYEAARGVDLLAELALRLAGGALPGHAPAVLGLGHSGETALDRLRLLTLGARTVRDGEARRTTLVMADVDTGTRLVLAHDWQVPAARQADEASLRAAERVAPGVLLQALAQGQMLSQQAARRPDGSVRLARARSAQNSVLPQSGDWAMLGPPVRFDSVAALVADQHAHPHAALQPRHAARRFVVFSPAEVGGVVYDAQAQSVLALLHDADGQTLLLRRAHERHTPYALDAVAAALTGQAPPEGQDKHQHPPPGPLRHVAGLLSWEQGVPCIEPWALACDALIVPDLAGPMGALSDLPLGASSATQTDPAARLTERLRQHLANALHAGLTLLPRSWVAESMQLARALRDAGLPALGGQLQALAPQMAQAQAGPHAAAQLAHAFMQLAALLQLHLDALALAPSGLAVEPLKQGESAPHAAQLAP